MNSTCRWNIRTELTLGRTAWVQTFSPEQLLFYFSTLSLSNVRWREEKLLSIEVSSCLQLLTNESSLVQFHLTTPILIKKNFFELRTLSNWSSLEEHCRQSSIYTELTINSSWKLNSGNPCFSKLSIETQLKCCSSVSQSSHIPSLIRDCENHCFDKVMPAVVLRFCQISEICFLQILW